MAFIRTPLSSAAICRAGSASPCSTLHVAIEHLTLWRAVSRFPGRFSCRFQSSSVSACPRSCLYANRARDAQEICKAIPRLHTPSGGSLSVTPAPRPPEFPVSVRVNTRPSVCFLCGRGTSWTWILAPERPEERVTPSDVSRPTARNHDVIESQVKLTGRLSSRAARAVRPKPNPPTIATPVSGRSIDIPVP